MIHIRLYLFRTRKKKLEYKHPKRSVAKTLKKQKVGGGVVRYLLNLFGCDVGAWEGGNQHRRWLLLLLLHLAVPFYSRRLLFFFPRKNPKLGAERRRRVRRRGLLEDKSKRCERGKREKSPPSFIGYFLQMGRIGENERPRIGAGEARGGECERLKRNRGVFSLFDYFYT